jgi:transcriptional regulator with PAS, ATPase and Fis domain
MIIEIRFRVPDSGGGILHDNGLVARYTFTDLVGTSCSFRQAVARGRQFAQTDLTVLIAGESGTGKELFAHAVHRGSRRAEGPFVALNCAAVPESLLESELFGYDEGAFTGARKGGKPGLFEMAHGGTIFLDEIGELGIKLQARLLRVLQQREVMRVGGERVISVDVRVVAATNRNLARQVAEGRFRDDLYYRLNVLTVVLPPLRERREDIPILGRQILAESCRLTGVAAPLPDACLRILQEHSWPGNVRELENFLHKYAVLCQGAPDPVRIMSELMNEATLSLQSLSGQELSINVDIGTLEEMENQILVHLDRSSGMDRAELARFLGISRTTLWKRLKEIKPCRH